MTTSDEQVLDIVEESDELADTPATPVDPSALRVWAPAARPAVVQALEAGAAEVLDTPDGATYAVVSTRLPRHRIVEYISVARVEHLPVIVLVHPGGEAAAVEALRGGGQLAIAEGDGDALRALADGDVDDRRPTQDLRVDALLDAYESTLNRSQAVPRTPVTLVDQISGLPASGALQLRLTALATEGVTGLRVVSIAIAALGDPLRVRMGAEAHAILHRRIAGGMKALCNGVGDLFDVGDGGFVLLSQTADVARVELLGHQMGHLVESYMPDGHLPLTIAIGHAGPECSVDPATLRELAGRAELAARQEERSAVLGAGELVKSLATATELEVTMRLAEVAATRDGAPSREAVASMANQIAARMGLEARDRLLVRFCATVGGIGAALTDDTAQQADAGSTLLATLAGPGIAATLAAVHEHWDGSGAPHGLAGAAIPTPARIIAVAERLVADGNTTDGIEAGSGSAFDPTVVQAAMEAVTSA